MVLDNLKTNDYNFFLCRIYVTSNDGSQNMFDYQRTFNVLRLNSGNVTEYIISWKSKGV